MNIKLDCEVFELNNFRHIDFNLICHKYGILIREINPICIYNEGFGSMNPISMHTMNYYWRPVDMISGFNVKYSLNNFSTILEKIIIAKKYIVFHKEDFFTTDDFFTIKSKLNLE